MPRTFLYNAQAHALGGFVTRPLPQRAIDTVAGVSLPITGGHDAAHISNFSLLTPRLSICSASTEVSGSQATDGSYNTVISTAIDGLVIADPDTREEIVTADAIDMTIATRHPDDDSETTVQITGSIHNLVVKGEPVNIVLDTCLNDAPTYTQFDQKYGNSPNVSKSKNPGMMRCSLIKKLTHSHAQPPTDQQVLVVPNFGKIYLGEVHMIHNTRRVTMMRLELGSPVAGSIALGGGSGNGNTFP